ncbi:malonic semialdehyde reductase [Paludibacterium yongneupense]|uniref:malonic semialdehyde reductase n=1 Tax=Paludibacterium yongneupense TaxID=400061 RepID=UPI000423BB09|nr:malonic semialdehyde reductase [Paludibacterium yongneupense]
MAASLDQAAQEQIFVSARTFNKFTDRTVNDETVRRLYDLLKWGPTSMNAQPGRYLVLRSAEARARLLPALGPSNVDKTRLAPLTVIIAHDTRFYDQLPTQFPAYDARPMFEANAELASLTALRNGTLQGAYLIIAARMLGLDAGPMSGFDNARVDAEFFPDGGWKSNFIVNLGYGDASGNHPRGPRLPFDTAVKVL